MQLGSLRPAFSYGRVKKYRFYATSRGVVPLRRSRPGFRVPHQIEGLEPLGKRQLGGFHDGSCSDSSLMTTASALIAPVATPIHETMLLLSTSGTAESIWLAGFL